MIPGEKVRLRPLTRADLPSFVEWLADPELRNHLAVYNPMSLEDEERWYEQNLEAGHLRAWAIDAAVQSGGKEPQWRLIGSCGFHNIDWRSRTGEVGILIGDKSNWGRGYGADAMKILLDWGFGTLNLNRVYLKVFDDNPRGIRCYEKVGFQHEGRLRQDDFRNGTYRDTLIMGILRHEWK